MAQTPAFSTFVLAPQPADGAAEQLAGRGKPIVLARIRPERAVILGQPLDAATATLIGVKADHPFVAGIRLYGWPEAPGLYCDLLRPRGLGSSAACLFDRDDDGRFDEGVRFDFNSGRADRVFITHSEKAMGAKEAKRLPLPSALAYSASDAVDRAEANVRLAWESNFTKRKDPAAPVVGAIWLDASAQYTGTDARSKLTFTFVHDGRPIEVDAFGARLTLLGFDAKGNLRYRFGGIATETPVEFGFRGYIIRIIGY